MKYVIIGGNTGGAGAAARLRRLDEQARIVMLEKGGHVSYSNCSLPYRLSGTVDQTEKLVLNTPEALRDSYNIETRTASEAVAIDRQAKQGGGQPVHRQDGGRRGPAAQLFAAAERPAGVGDRRRLHRHRGGGQSAGGRL